MEAKPVVILKIKDQEFTLDLEEAKELYQILGAALGINAKSDLTAVKQLLEEWRAKNPSPIIPQPYPVPMPVPVWPTPYLFRRWDITYSGDTAKIASKSEQ